jgi:cytidyltransferase-like protein
MKTKVFVSGGFDPIHIGHVRMIQEAAKLGSLTVILNNDRWLFMKKGFIFMPQKERAELLLAIKGVEYVWTTWHDENCIDMSVVKDLASAMTYYQDDFDQFIFCNGGDRREENSPEHDFCLANGVELVYNVGGGKIQSSTELARKVGNQRDVLFVR